MLKVRPKKQKFDSEYKIILIGESGVGKTSIITRYVEDQFREEEKSSVNAQFSEKVVPVPNTEKHAKLNIWDTLGQERFTKLTHLFYTGA